MKGYGMNRYPIVSQLVLPFALLAAEARAGGTSAVPAEAGPAPAKGRIAVVADGNYRDSDDIAGTPVSLAILRALGLEKTLVHYSHSCDLKPGTGDPGGEFREREMQESCDGTAGRWGGFDHLRFQNALRTQDATANHLAQQIDKSSESDPLWIIEAGEPDILWMAVNRSEAAKRKHVFIVTHHPANDAGDTHDLADVMRLGIPEANLHRIPDQNTLLKKPLNTWHWARDHKDGRIKWLWERGNLAQTAAMKYPGIVGSFDPSDAGMIWYWATLDKGGDRACDVPKLQKLFTEFVTATSIAPRAVGGRRISLRSIPTWTPGESGIVFAVDAAGRAVFQASGADGSVFPARLAGTGFLGEPR